MQIILNTIIMTSTGWGRFMFTTLQSTEQPRQCFSISLLY